jgi:hypothetical protein
MDLPSRTSPPLTSRLPNPPPLFVGRHREMEALAAAMARCPVAVLCGPGGVGKTALALWGMARLPGFDVERALLIDLRPGQPVEDVRLQIIRVLAQAHGIEWVGWADVLHDDESAGGALIDLAESGGYWIVLDDLHNIGAASAASLLLLLARYARRSRWIVTSRTTPSAVELLPQYIVLDGLAEDELRSLGAAFAPAIMAADLAAAVASSGGSPWLLQQLLSSPGDGDIEDRLLAGLPEGAMDFLKAILPIDKALPLTVLASFTPLPIRELLTQLEQRGIIQHGYGGYRLHDVVRRLIGASPIGGHSLPSPLVAGRPLSAQHDPEAMLEGARLLLSVGVVEDVLTMLERFGGSLLENGYAPRLWQLLELSPDPRLARWRLRCAVALAQPTLLAQLPPPTEPDAEELLLWARALLIQGNHEAAQDIAAARYEEAKGVDPRLAVQAGLLAVECLSSRRQYHEAELLLSALKPVDAESGALHDSWSAYCMAAAGHVEEAARRIQTLQQRHQGGALPARARDQVLLNLAKVMGLIGRPIDAYRVSSAVLASSLASAKSLSVHFVVVMDLGHFGEAGALLRRLEPFRGDGSPLRHVEAVHLAYHQFCIGALAAFQETLSYWKPELRRLGDASRLQALIRVEILHKMSLAESPPPGALADEGLAGGPRNLWGRLYMLRWRARAGERLPPVSDVVSTHSPASGYYHTYFGVIQIDALLAAGQASAALELCHRVIADLRTRGLGAVALELDQVHCDILLTLGRWGELEQGAEDLARRATESGSPKMSTEAQFYGAFAQRRPVDWGLLEVLATRLDTAPIAARRARALLGRDTPLDAVDQRVLAALKDLRGVAPAVSLALGRPCNSADPRFRDEPGWGLADEHRQVWLPDGTSRSLASSPQLWSILASLFEHGGAASKEQLVRDIWNETEYHPLRHDNRLQVAVRKLRQLLEDEASRPTRLVTIAVGYALAGCVRRARSP